MERKEYYSTIEAAKILGVSDATTRRMSKDGRFNGCKEFANRILIPAREVEKYLVPIEEAERMLAESRGTAAGE